MMQALNSPSLGVFLEASSESLATNNGFKRCSSSPKKLISSPFVVGCSSSSSSGSCNYIPKSKPFNSSFLDRALKDPPLIQKTENWIADYCTTLEGDECYSCWRAYFELKELEEEEAKEDVERMIVDAGGMKSLIKRVHQVSSNHKADKEEQAMKSAALSKVRDEELRKKTKKVPEHVPDGIPKPGEEMKDVADEMYSGSPHMNLLRAMHIYPSWYTPAPGYCMD